MAFTKALLATISAAVAVSAFNGTANLGFFGTTNCGCPPWNGPYAAAIPSNTVGDAVCCNDVITITYLDQTTTAVFSGIYDAGAGTEDIALSSAAFAALAGHPEETSLSPVTWSFKSN
ncbi:hypothetical protein B0H15DRAFT_473021 [Mycena belliarum]|uniref:Uncharacterized protein n=1 Tax=Mycena belliarum TaxID=1033014 RepID=A0AAD6TXP9_9AGAR|nr:hypothetical protein B0H15DRAFT_473021 [Mycena belliae]